MHCTPKVRQKTFGVQLFLLLFGGFLFFHFSKENNVCYCLRLMISLTLVYVFVLCWGDLFLPVLSLVFLLVVTVPC